MILLKSRCRKLKKVEEIYYIQEIVIHILIYFSKALETFRLVKISSLSNYFAYYKALKPKYDIMVSVSKLHDICLVHIVCTLPLDRTNGGQELGSYAFRPTQLQPRHTFRPYTFRPVCFWPHTLLAHTLLAHILIDP